jgi:hypothetical protein
VVVACATEGALVPYAHGADDVAGNLMLVNDNGAWSWFEDERAVVDAGTGNVLVGSIGDASGTGGAARNGVVDVASFNLSTRRVTRSPLATIVADDHNTPALLVRPDGRYLAAYANHGSDTLTRYRISTNPGDPTSWGPAQSFTNAAGATYNNVYRLSAENKTYNFTRTVGFDPNYLLSADDGSTWSYGGKLLQDPANNNSTRPYLKYASNDTDRVDFITTEGHPRDVNNGVYHGYLQGGTLYRTDGTPVGPLGSSPAASAFTPVFTPTAARNHGWTTDLAHDAAGNPVAVFTTRVDNLASADHRFFYGRVVGGTWQVHEMAMAGAGLYGAEGDYTGLAAIDWRDPSTVYVSTNIDPQDNQPLGNHEIYKGVTPDNGATWAWTPVTQNSTVDNLRPVLPKWSGGTALMWMRGTYNSYTDYDLSIVGLVGQDGQSVGKIGYTDATLNNTTVANGNPLTATGPSANGGATDNQWHRRTGFGNDNEVFTAGEGGDENAPALRTTVADVAAGEYDVFAYFWANPLEEWQIAAGLSESELRTFRKDFAEQASADDFAATVVLAGDTVSLYQAYLGRVKLTSAGALPVFVDDSPFGIGTSTRTWYDGVGLAAVVPEPATSTLLALAAPVTLARRRGRRRLSVST